MTICSKKGASVVILIAARAASRNRSCHFTGREDGRPQPIYHTIFINIPMVLLLVGVIPFWIPDRSRKRNHIRFEKSYLIEIRCINFHFSGNSSTQTLHKFSLSRYSCVEIIRPHFSQIKSSFSNSAIS